MVETVNAWDIVTAVLLCACIGGLLKLVVVR